MSSRAASSETDGLSSAWQDEAALLARVAAGDPAASRAVVDRYLGSIHRFAYRLLGDQAEAEDIAQEAFLRLWRQAARWEPRATIGTWLYRVARNLCVDRLRARQTRRQAPPPEPPEPTPDGASLLERRELSESVQQAIEELPERQRMALVLVHYEGLRNYEAAEVMEVHVDALESLLARARRQLRQRLRPLREGRGAPVRSKGDDPMRRKTP